MELKDMPQLYVIPDTNVAYLFLKDVSSKSFNEHAPIISKRVKGCFCLRLTVKVKAKLNVKDQLHRNLRNSNKATKCKIYKTAKNFCNNTVRHAKKSYGCNLLSEHQNNLRKFWNIIKSILPRSKVYTFHSSVNFSDKSKTAHLIMLNTYPSLSI